MYRWRISCVFTIFRLFFSKGPCLIKARFVEFSHSYFVIFQPKVPQKRKFWKLKRGAKKHEIFNFHFFHFCEINFQIKERNKKMDNFDKNLHSISTTRKPWDWPSGCTFRLLGEVQSASTTVTCYLMVGVLYLFLSNNCSSDRWGLLTEEPTNINHCIVRIPNINHFTVRITEYQSLYRYNYPIPTIVSLELPDIDHCIVRITQYQPFYRWNYPISTIVSLELPSINRCIVRITQYQPLYRWNYPMSTIVSLELPVNHS